MQIKYFTIPAFDNGAANEELNKFLRSHRVRRTSPFLTHSASLYKAAAIRY